MAKVIIYAMKDRDSIFYIGQSKNLVNRKGLHIRQSYQMLTEKDKKIQEMLSQGREPIMEPIKECNAKNALEEEEKTIKFFLFEGHPLLNIVHNRPLLSEIERDVLILMSEDYDTMEMAIKLYRSHRTIETVRQKIKEKANVKTAAGVIIWGIKNGYIAI